MVNPISFTPTRPTQALRLKRNPQPGERFGSIYPLFRRETLDAYEAAKQAQPNEHLLRPYATSLFREHHDILALTKVIGNQPTDVHILGSSDGSEAFAHAIALKETLGVNAPSKTSVTGVDREAFLVDLANTNHLVLADLERDWVNSTTHKPNNPLRGDGWDRYLTLSPTAPTEFNDIVAREPKLAQITRDTVSNVEIGRGLNWYKVNMDGLPPVKFKHADMTQYLRTAPLPKNQQAFVLANSWAYIMQQQGPRAFLEVLDVLKSRSKGKSMLVVTGDTEMQIFSQMPDIITHMRMRGLEPLSEEELRKAGVAEPRKVFGNIWRLHKEPRIQVQVVYI